MSAEPYLPSDAEPVLPSDRARVDPALTGSAHSPNGTSAEPELPSDRAPLDRASPPVAPMRAAESRETPPAAGDDTRTGRIRQATARGMLGGHVPARYEDEDWETVRSTSPFEVLYLDYRQPGAISAAVLDDRRQTLAGFWKQKDDVRNRNAGGQRERIERRYGFEVGTYVQRVERAYRQLSEPGALAREAQVLDEARRRAGEHELQRVVRTSLADGLLTVEETETLLQDGDAAGLTREETADYLSRVLSEQRFTEREPRRGDTLPAVLLSTEWVSPERRAREDVEAARNAARMRRHEITPIKFRHGAARTLDELLDLCDRYPAEAEDYLAEGVLDPWLAGAAGEAEAASTAKRLRVAYPTARRRALELFARSLAAPLGLSTAPVLTAQPAECMFGALPQGAQRRMRVEFVREASGRPFVWGTARLEHDFPGLGVSRTFTDDAAGLGASIAVTLDTLDAPPGDYATRVIIEPEGGAPLAVPVRYAVVPLTLTPDRAAIDFGTIPSGQTRSATVRVTVSPNGGRLAGVVRLGAPHAGVTLDGAVREDGSDARFTVDSRATGPGVRYQSELRFETNAGVVRVPVTFRVRSTGTEVRLWAGVLAIIGGIGMWLTRQLAVAGADWHLTYPGWSHGASLAAAGTVVAVLGFAARGVVRRFRKR